MAKPAPKWLSNEQQVIWRSWLEGAMLIEQELDAALRPFGIDLGEYEILVRLSESDNHSFRMSDLALAVSQSRSRLTHTVARMESKGWIVRHASPDDKRGVLATLTPKGLDFLTEVAPVHVQSVRDCFVDIVDPGDFVAVGRAMQAVLQVAD